MSSESANGNDGDPFNGTAYVPDSDGKFSRTCNWRDKLAQQHTVSASLDLPNIASYELQHTAGSYSQINSLLDDLITRSGQISGILNGTAVALGSTAGVFIIAFAVNVVTVLLYNCHLPWCKAAWVPACAAMVAIHEGLKLEQSWWVSTLSAIVAAAGGTSVYLLQSDNDKVFGDWAPDGIQSINGTQCIKTDLTCNPCNKKKADNTPDYSACQPCQDAQDLMIVKIAGVTLPSWLTTCVATQTHPGTSSGIIATNYPAITSSCTSKFDGGDIGAFEDTYDPKITATK
jgi:hypothetical protein